MATGQAAYDPKNIIGSLPQVDDSMANQVTKLASKDSELNRMAAVEGLKVANRRGLLNSSMGVEASQDAVLKNVIPIAGQDAQTAANKNAAAKAFEYGMTAQEAQQTFQTGEREAGQGFITSERLGTQTFQGAQAEAERKWQTGENVAARGWQTAENIAQRGFLSTQAELDRTLERTLQANQIKANDILQIRQIASTEGIEAANRALQKTLQENDIEFRMKEGKLDREAAKAAQTADIAFQQQEGRLTRDLQERIANMNLSSSDRNAASSFLTSMETMYQSTYQSIMNNTALDAKTRDKYLTAAKNMRSGQIDFVEQLYDIDLDWGSFTK